MICQFAISIALIIGSITIYQQVDFMKNQDPGFEKQQKLILEFPLTDSFTSRYEVAKAQFIQHPQITATTASSTVPGLTFNTSKIFPTGQENEKGMSINFIRVDHDFLQDYNIKMVAGRRFMRGMETDRAFGAIIINESMVKALGWATPEEALQHTFYDPPRPIIGVAKDFHIQGFQHAIEPLYMNLWPDRFRYLTLTVGSDNLAETLSFVKQTHASLFPDLPYNAFFLDTAFANQYHFEEQFNRIIGLFSLLGIFIACLGMFGLAAYLLESRTKEVGIRKTLGASLPNLMLLLTKAFMLWVLFGIVLAWPIAYVALSRWLDSFAYHIPLEWPPFVVAAVLSLAIALLTVSYHVIKTATRNPVKALRYE